MLFRFTEQELEQKIKHNKSVFNRTCIALRRGIVSIYYRDHNNRDKILKIYDENIFKYIDYIYDIIMVRIRMISKDYSKKTMFNNILILIVLFFIIDLEIIEKDSNSLSIQNIEQFLDLIIYEGFKHNEGNVNFRLDPVIIFNLMNFNINSFSNFLLLQNPVISIFYNKKNGSESPTLELENDINVVNKINIPFSPINVNKNDNNNVENISQKQISNTSVPVETPVFINNFNTVPNVLNNLEENNLEKINLLSMEILQLRQLLAASLEQNAFLTNLNSLIIQQKEILIHEIENLKLYNKYLNDDNDIMRRERDQSFENEFTKSLTYSIFN